MRFNVTPEGLAAAAGQDVSLAEIIAVLDGGERRLVEDIDERRRSVTGHTPAGRLIVWLVAHDHDDEEDVMVAFEAGLTQQAKWNHMFGRTS